MTLDERLTGLPFYNGRPGAYGTGIRRSPTPRWQHRVNRDLPRATRQNVTMKRPLLGYPRGALPRSSPQHNHVLCAASCPRRGEPSQEIPRTIIMTVGTRADTPCIQRVEYPDWCHTRSTFYPWRCSLQTLGVDSAQADRLVAAKSASVCTSLLPLMRACGIATPPRCGD